MTRHFLGAEKKNKEMPSSGLRVKHNFMVLISLLLSVVRAF